MALKGPEKGPCCLLALRPNDHITLFSPHAFLQQSFSHSPSLTLRLEGSGCCSVLLQEEILLCGPSLDAQKRTHRANPVLSGLVVAHSFSKILQSLGFFSFSPTCLLLLITSDQQQGPISHIQSLLKHCSAQESAQISLSIRIFSPCDVEVYVSLKNPCPCF